MIYDDADMGKVAGEHPGDEIAGEIIFWLLGAAKLFAFSFKENLKIGHTPMVDIFIGAFEAPYFWIFTKVGLHIFVNDALQVDSCTPVSAHDDVCADPDMVRHVTHRIVQLSIAAIVDDNMRQALHGGCYEASGEGRLR